MKNETELEEKIAELVRAIKVRDSRLVRFIHNSQNRAVQ